MLLRGEEGVEAGDLDDRRAADPTTPTTNYGRRKWTVHSTEKHALETMSSSTGQGVDAAADLELGRHACSRRGLLYSTVVSSGGHSMVQPSSESPSNYTVDNSPVSQHHSQPQAILGQSRCSVTHVDLDAGQRVSPTKRPSPFRHTLSPYSSLSLVPRRSTLSDPILRSSRSRNPPGHYQPLSNSTSTAPYQSSVRLCQQGILKGLKTDTKSPIQTHPSSLDHLLSFTPVTMSNCDHLRALNRALFPVVYSESFYTDLCHVHPKGLSTLAFTKDSGVLAGAICCRKEPISSDPLVNAWDVYVMTLGVSADYRRMKLGSALLAKILAFCQSDPTLQFCCLHVHTFNAPALAFYASHGFTVHSRVPNYYAQDVVHPPDAYLLKLRIPRWST